MTDTFTGRTVFVTGGASGIGAAVCRRLATAGAAVAVADQNDAGATALASELEASGVRAIGIGLDVTDRTAVGDAVRRTVSEFGGLHGAVNSAGIGGTLAPLAEYDPDTWTKVLDVNLNGVFHCMQAEIEEMLAGGGGAVVNVSSIHGSNGHPGHAAYVAAKHGVIGLTKVGALDYAARGIRINSVGPGYVETAMSHTAMADPQKRAATVAVHPVGRLGTADEVAALVCFLLSDDSAFIHGSHHLVDGGFSAR
jgi:NAD(P)-dependent dehydrogenase (short-subunit alcohol dehydrogenase family)